jgi:hypothetical protein
VWLLSPVAFGALWLSASTSSLTEDEGMARDLEPSVNRRPALLYGPKHIYAEKIRRRPAVTDFKSWAISGPVQFAFTAPFESRA